MTLDQSKAFILNKIASRTPVYFSEEALLYIDSKGGLKGKYIKWHGEDYTVTKVHQADRIVEAVRTQRRLQPTDRLEPGTFSMLVTDQAWQALPKGVSLEYVMFQLDQMEQGATQRRPAAAPRSTRQAEDW